MSPKDWGPPIWYFFHCMVENIKDDKFNIIGIQCFQMIRQICRVLPCQTCSNHASQFLITIKQNQIKSKNDLKNIIYIFHNYVNKKNNKQLFHVYDLDMYKNSNLINAYNNFVKAYQTKGNMKLMADSFSRTTTLKYVKQFITSNAESFTFHK